MIGQEPYTCGERLALLAIGAVILALYVGSIWLATQDQIRGQYRPVPAELRTLK